MGTVITVLWRIEIIAGIWGFSWLVFRGIAAYLYRREEARWMAQWREYQQWHQHGGHPTRQGFWVIEGKEEEQA